MFLSHLGCQIFFWLGLMDQKGCDDLRIQEENLEPFMWFKLLFVPSLGIIILTSYLLEDYCHSFQLEVHDFKQVEDIISKPRKYRSFWRRSDKPQNNKHKMPSEPIRLNLVDENGVNTCYKIEPSVSMREVVNFYCQRHNTSADSIILRHDGTRLRLSETPEKLGLGNMAIIDVEIDYYKLCEDINAESDVNRWHLESLIAEKKRSCKEMEEKTVQIKKDLEEFSKVRSEKEKELKQLESEKANLQLALDQLAQELKTHREARKVAEAMRSKAKKNLVTEKEKKERKRLEKLHQHIKLELEQKHRELTEATKRYSQEIRQHDALKVALRSCHEKIAILEKNISKWKTRAHKLTLQLENQDKKAWANLEKKKKKLKSMDSCNKELLTWKSRAKVLGKELKELQKWQASVQKSFKKEPLKLKKLKESMKIRLAAEKNAEREVLNLKECRQYAREFSKKIKELRLWKKRFLEMNSKLQINEDGSLSVCRSQLSQIPVCNQTYITSNQKSNMKNWMPSKGSPSSFPSSHFCMSNASSVRSNQTAQLDVNSQHIDTSYDGIPTSGSVGVSIPHPTHSLANHSLPSACQHNLPSRSHIPFSSSSPNHSNFSLHTLSASKHYMSTSNQHRHTNVGSAIRDTASDSSGILSNVSHSSRINSRTSTHPSHHKSRVASYQHPARLATCFSQPPQSRQTQLSTHFYNPANECFSGKPLSIIDDLGSRGASHHLQMNSVSSSRSHAKNNQTLSTVRDTNLNNTLNTSFNTSRNTFSTNAFNSNTFSTNKPLVIIHDN